MPTNLLNLDVTRKRLDELCFSASRVARNISPPQGGKNRCFFWKGAQTWTLQPINLTTAFFETLDWEGLKLRLPDFNYDPNFAAESPENKLLRSDFFIHAIVQALSLPTGFPYSSPSTPILANTFNVAILYAINAESNANPSSVVMLQSKQSFPANQGFTLRFYVEGTGSESVAAVYDFAFGDFLLRFNSNAVAELFHSPPGNQVYTQVGSFFWTQPANVHGRFHKVTIFPHARNCIEFISLTGVQIIGPFYRVNSGAEYDFAYRVPGQLLPDGNGDYIITQPGPCSVAVNRNFKPHIQVSRLAFFNGTTYAAYLQDQGISTDRGLTAQVRLAIDADLNGGRISSSLLEESTGRPFVSGPNARKPQAQFQFTGIGDIDGPGLGSTKTPELYGYMMDKSALFYTDSRVTHSVVCQDVTLDYGANPEEERATFKIDNSQVDAQGKAAGQVEAYTERGDIPLTLTSGTGANQLTLFEGQASQVDSQESPATEARQITIEARGMNDILTRFEWFSNIPDFGADPNANGKTWHWTDAVRRCFEAAGFAPEDVVIEEESKWKFRLWFLDTGGTKGGGSHSTGHQDGNVQSGTAWRPFEGTAVGETVKMLLHDCLGWNWHWDRKDHKWHIYKRPDPTVAYDAPKLVPKVAFYSVPSELAAAQKANVLPSYDLCHFEKSTKRPEASVVELLSIVNEAIPLTKTEYAQQMAGIQSDPSGFDSGLKYQDRLAVTHLENPYGTTLTPGHEADFVGIRFRVVPIPLGLGRAGIAFTGRIAYRDNCFAHTFGSFEADWGDKFTYNLRKYDVVTLKTPRMTTAQKWFIYRIEPHFSSNLNMRARYQVVRLRTDTSPPR